MSKGKLIRAIVKTKEGWSSETEVPDPPPAEVEATVSSIGPEYHGGMVSRLLECTGTFRFTGWSGKTPLYEQILGISRRPAVAWGGCRPPISGVLQGWYS